MKEHIEVYGPDNHLRLQVNMKQRLSMNLNMVFLTEVHLSEFQLAQLKEDGKDGWKIAGQTALLILIKWLQELSKQ